MKRMATIGGMAAQGAAVVGFLVLTGCATRHAAVTSEAVVPPTIEAATNVVAPEVVIPAPLPVVAKTYVVKAGDSASKIAKKCGCTTRDLIACNNLKNANAIRVGQTLKLPDGAKAPAGAEAVAGHKAVKHAAGGKTTGHNVAGGAYTVVAGDSLGKIAHQHGTTVAAIKSANNLSSDSIRLGQKLVIPAGKAGVTATKKGVNTAKPDAAATGTKDVAAVVGAPEGDATMLAATNGPAKSSEILHVVEANQDLASIAMMYGVRQEDLMKANNLTSPQVTAGQTLKIPPPAMP